MPLQVLILGNPAGPCRRTVEDDLRLPEAVVRRSNFPSGPVDFEPDLVLVCQDWPDEFASADVAALIARWPLARLVCVYGPWCEGDGRTRDVWPLAVRVPLPEALRRIDRECDVIAGRTPPLPFTASRTEIFAAFADGCDADRPNLAGTSAAVVSPDPAWKSLLEAELRDQGARVDDHPSAAGRVIWDADPDTPGRRAELASVSAGRSPPEVTVVAGLVDGGNVTWKLSPLEVILRRAP